jgi:hypothetical protein
MLHCDLGCGGQKHSKMLSGETINPNMTIQDMLSKPAV